MDRDVRIEELARSLCSDCKQKLEQYISKNPKNAGRVAMFALTHLCTKCKQKILQKSAEIHGR